MNCGVSKNRNHSAAAAELLMFPHRPIRQGCIGRRNSLATSAKQIAWFLYKESSASCDAILIYPAEQTFHAVVRNKSLPLMIYRKNLCICSSTSSRAMASRF
jgi:hypothetical protein